MFIYFECMHLHTLRLLLIQTILNTKLKRDLYIRIFCVNQNSNKWKKYFRQNKTVQEKDFITKILLYKKGKIK